MVERVTARVTSERPLRKCWIGLHRTAAGPDPRLDAAGIRTGDTRHRPAAIAALDAGEAGAFPVSVEAGGLGLDVVSADTAAPDGL